MSIADDFIRVMAKISRIETNNDDPTRYPVRLCKNSAEAILAAAIRQASDIADIAQAIQADYATSTADGEGA